VKVVIVVVAAVAAVETILNVNHTKKNEVVVAAVDIIAVVVMKCQPNMQIVKRYALEKSYL